MSHKTNDIWNEHIQENMTTEEKQRNKIATSLAMSIQTNEDGEIEYIGTGKQHAELNNRMTLWEENEKSEKVPF